MQRESVESIFARVPQAARMLNISRSKTYEGVATGEIPAKRIGGVILIPIDWIRRQAAEAMGET